MIELSEGAIDAIIAGESIENPIFQILGHRRLGSLSDNERYRLSLSDGRKIFSFVTLSQQLNRIVGTELTDFTMVQINRFTVMNNNSAGQIKKIMFIASLDVKRPGSEVGGKIGNPVQLEASSETAKSKNPPAGPSRKRSRIVNLSDEPIITPIAQLTPWSNRWRVKARVSNKTVIRTWNNSRGQGKLFSMDLVDESGEIRCTAFKEYCDKFFDMIEISKVYYISRCPLRSANMKYMNLSNEYEMIVNADTEIVACHDDDAPKLSYDFKPLSIVETSAKADLIDVLAIVKSYDQDVQTMISRREGKDVQLLKRDLQLVDMSMFQVTLTLWGTQAKEFKAAGDNCLVLAAKASRVGDYLGDKVLTTIYPSRLDFAPNLPEAQRLRDWYNTTGKDQELKVLGARDDGGRASAPIMTVIEVTSKNLEVINGDETYVVKAFPSQIYKELLYKMCPTEGCHKKLVDQPDEMYRCEKCDREYSSFKIRMLASIEISDWTGSMWVTAFNDDVERLLGVTAQQLAELKKSNTKAFDDIFTDALFKPHFFNIRTGLRTWNDEKKLNVTVRSVGPVDRKVYRDHLMLELKRLTNVETD